MQLMDHPPSPQMIYDYRMRWGLSQEDAGKLIGSSRQAWQHWESGERHMPKPIQYLLWLMERQPRVRHTVIRFNSSHVNLGTPD
jgi:DNA-binding transcriptional regulator YiaG